MGFICAVHKKCKICLLHVVCNKEQILFHNLKAFSAQASYAALISNKMFQIASQKSSYTFFILFINTLFVFFKDILN